MKHNTYILFFSILISQGCQSTKHSSSFINKEVAGLARLKLGLAYLASGNDEVAIVNLQKAVLHLPNDYRIQLGMAFYFEHIKEYELANIYYNKAVKLEPKNGMVLNDYGTFLCAQNQYKQGLNYLEKSLSAYKNSPVQAQYSLENIGYCHLWGNELEQAKKVLTDITINNPKKAESLLVESERLLGLQNYNKARVLLEIYQYSQPVSAQSLWLTIRFAVLDGEHQLIRKHGAQLKQRFPHSQQYQRFLANEY